MSYVAVGDMVRVCRFVAHEASIAGTQPKTAAVMEDFWGTVASIHGDSPTAPTHVRFRIRRADGSETEVDSRHIAAVLSQRKMQDGRLPESVQTEKWNPQETT